MNKVKMQLAVLMTMVQGIDWIPTRGNCVENNFAYWEKFSTKKSKAKKKKKG